MTRITNTAILAFIVLYMFACVLYAVLYIIVYMVKFSNSIILVYITEKHGLPLTPDLALLRVLSPDWLVYAADVADTYKTYTKLMKTHYQL